MVAPRTFTPEEDELIIANANWRLSLRKLLLTLHCCEETAALRASQLGVELTRMKHVGGPRYGARHERYKKQQGPSPGDGRCDTPHVGKDKLLQRLREYHGK